MSVEWVEIGPCKLALGDCRDVLATVRSDVDAAVFDPPYGISGGKGGDARDFQKGNYLCSEWEDTEDYIREVMVPVVEEVVGWGIPVGITPGNRCSFFYPRPRDVGGFWTPAAVTHGPWGFTTFQPILYYGKDWRAGRGALPSGRQVTERARPTGHPCPKPAKAWEWLVDKVAPPGATVFDPCFGGGETAIACVNTGRRFIGCEIEREYFDIACRRIEAAVADQRSLLPLEVA